MTHRIKADLAAELSRVFARYGQTMHEIDVYVDEAHGMIQIAALATDRAQNMTGLSGTGLQKIGERR